MVHLPNLAPLGPGQCQTREFSIQWVVSTSRYQNTGHRTSQDKLLVFYKILMY